MFGGIWQSARLVAFSGAAFSELSVLADAQLRHGDVSAAVHHADGLTAVIEIVRGPDGDPAAIMAWTGQGRRDRSGADGSRSGVVGAGSSRALHGSICGSKGEAGAARAPRPSDSANCRTQGDQLLFNGESGACCAAR